MSILRNPCAPVTPPTSGGGAMAADREPLDLIMLATAAYQAGWDDGKGWGYLGREAAGRVWDAATPSEWKAIRAWLVASGFGAEFGWAERDHFVHFAGQCCYGIELECRPKPVIELAPLPFDLVPFERGRGFLAVPKVVPIAKAMKRRGKAKGA